MKLDEFGDKYGDEIAAGVEGFYRGRQIRDENADRAERRADRATMRGRQEEAYQHGLTRRPIADEIQNNQLARDRIGLTQVQDANDFKTTVRKDAVQALKGFQVGNTDLVGNFYNQYVEDGKTGSFVQDKDGSYRHEYVDDITGEAGTEVFSQDQMQAVLQRASQADDEFLSMLEKMRAATAEQKNKLALDARQHENKVDLERVKDTSKAPKANELYDSRGMLVNNDSIGKDYERQYVVIGQFGEKTLREGAPDYQTYYNSRVPQGAKIPSQTTGLTQGPAPDYSMAAKMAEAEAEDRAGYFSSDTTDFGPGGRAAWVNNRTMEIAQQLSGGRPTDSRQGLTGNPNPGGGQTARGQVIRDDQPKAVQLPPEVAKKLREGVATTFGNGQVWTMQNGQPVRVK